MQRANQAQLATPLPTPTHTYAYTSARNELRWYAEHVLGAALCCCLCCWYYCCCVGSPDSLAVNIFKLAINQLSWFADTNL